MQTHINTDTQGGVAGSIGANQQGSYEGTCANLQIYGLVAQKSISQLDQISLEGKWGSGAPSRLKRFLHNSIHKPGGQR
jgi:hypothetical protein